MTPTPRPESSEELIAEAYHTALENPYIKPLCDRIRSLTTELAALKAQDEVHWKTRRSLIKERDAALAERDQQIAWAREAQPRMLEMAERGKAQFEALEQARAEANALRAVWTAWHTHAEDCDDCEQDECNEGLRLYGEAKARLAPAPAPQPCGCPGEWARFGQREAQHEWNCPELSKPAPETEKCPNLPGHETDSPPCGFDYSILDPKHGATAKAVGEPKSAKGQAPSTPAAENAPCEGKRLVLDSSGAIAQAYNTHCAACEYGWRSCDNLLHCPSCPQAPRPGEVR